MSAAPRPTVSHARFTRLETAVMAALAQELRGTIPDLAAQFASAKSGLRRNMAFGFYTGLTPGKTPPATTADGRFGTVHAMIDGLADAVAFQVLMRHGTVAALQSDSYGQDTRAIDIATIGFEQVFTLDAQGRSVPFETATAPTSTPTRILPPAPRPAQQAEPPRQAQNTRPASQPQTRQPQPTPPQRDPAFTFGLNGAVSTPPPIAPGTGFGSSTTDLPDVASMDDKTLLAGLWVAIAVIAFLLVTIFEVSWIFVLVPAIWAAQAIRRPAALSAIRKTLSAWQASAKASRPSTD